MAFYDIDKLIDSVKTSSPEAMEDEINANVKQGLAEIAQQLSDSRRFGSAIMPDAVTLQKQDFVNYNIGESFRQFVEKIDAICEIAILGQAGTTRDTPNGSFAKAKAMQVTTDNIRDADIQTTRALAAKAMQVILPLMTGAIKSEEVALEFIYDDNVDVLSFVNAIRSMNDMNIKTDRGNLFKIDVAELYRKLDITLNEAFYAKDEVFELGDKFEQELANELQPSAVAVGDEFKVK